MDVSLKGYILLALYLVFNLVLTGILLYLGSGYIVAAIFVVGGHARDVFSVFYQLVHLKDILERGPDDVPPPDGPVGSSTTIGCLVPVYKEDAEMVRANLDALTTQTIEENTIVVVVVVFDGLADHNRKLYDSVAETIRQIPDGYGGESWYTNWKSKRKTKLVYEVGSYNDTPLILAHKEERSGKKDSLIIGESFITSTTTLRWIEVDKVDFIYHTDGDTVSDKNCLNEMLKSMKHDPTLDGVSGLVRAYCRKGASCVERAFVMMQDFQYFFSIIVRRMTESLMGSTVCLPGCCNMVRVGARSEAAIAKYGNLPPNEDSLVQTVTRLQGTDRRYTTLLLRQGSKLRMNWRAFVRTEPPVTVKTLVNQRRRWSSNTFFNSLALLYSDNVPLYIRTSAVIDIGRTVTAIFRLISYISFWMFIREFSTPSLIFLCLAVLLPYVYAFVWIGCIVPEWGQMIAGFFLNKIFMPFFSAVAVTKMFMTSTNLSWSGVRDVGGGGGSREATMRAPEPDSSSPNDDPWRKKRKKTTGDLGRTRPPTCSPAGPNNTRRFFQ